MLQAAGSRVQTISYIGQRKNVLGIATRVYNNADFEVLCYRIHELELVIVQQRLFGVKVILQIFVCGVSAPRRGIWEFFGKFWKGWVWG